MFNPAGGYYRDIEAWKGMFFDAKKDARAKKVTIEELNRIEGRLDKLVLANAAMWSLLKDKAGLTEEDLLNRMQEIDLADGVADEKMTRTARECKNCGRMISKRHTTCMYCGGTNLTETTFESI
jgi:ribosomal protein S27AE